MAKTFTEINQKIKEGKAVILTADEVVELAKEKTPSQIAKIVDVVTTGTFGPMCSSGAFLNFGHTDPPIKMVRAWLNDVPAYGGLAAVDVYLGATELSDTKGLNYGGAHVIEDLISGKKIKLVATNYGTDCYPRKELHTYVSLKNINQAYLFNPRNAYQNYSVAVNSSDKTLYTYMGILLPHFGNATFSSSGQLSPLLKDPQYRTIGIGTRIFLGGGVGYVAWEGTQHNPRQIRDAKTKIPLAPAGTLALIGDLKKMDREFLRAAVFEKYGISLFIGVGIPIPVLDEEMATNVITSDRQIYTTVFDYGVARRKRPNLGLVSYAQLRSGTVIIKGKKVPTASLSSLYKAREIAQILKNWIKEGKFFLQEPIEQLPLDRKFKPLKIFKY